MGFFDAPYTSGSTAPPSWLTPYLQGYASEAKRLYDTGGPEYYPYSTVTPFSNQTNQALQMQEQRALGGSPLNQAASTNLQDTLSGRYLTPNSNPYSQGMFDNMSNSITDQVNSQFTAAGRYGSGAHTGTLTKELGNAGTNFFGNIYDQERQRQMQGLALAPGIANQDYYDISQLGNVGAQIENKAGQMSQEQKSIYDFYQNRPFDMMNQYANLINGNAQQAGQNSTQQYNPNGVQQLGMWSGLLGGFGGGNPITGASNLASGIGAGYDWLSNQAAGAGLWDIGSNVLSWLNPWDN